MNKINCDVYKYELFVVPSPNVTMATSLHAFKMRSNTGKRNLSKATSDYDTFMKFPGSFMPELLFSIFIVHLGRDKEEAVYRI